MSDGWITDYILQQFSLVLIIINQEFIISLLKLKSLIKMQFLFNLQFEQNIMQQKENLKSKLHQTALNGLANSKTIGKANDYVLKRYRLEENKLFKEPNNDEPQYQNQDCSNRIYNMDFQDELVIVPLEFSVPGSATQEEKIEQKLQHQQIFVFDDEEQNEDTNDLKQQDTIQHNVIKIEQTKNEIFGHKQIKDNRTLQETSHKQMTTDCNNLIKNSNEPINSQDKNKRAFFQNLNQLIEKQKKQENNNNLKGAILQKDALTSYKSITIIDRKTFSQAVLPPGIILKCIIRRNNSFINLISPEFDLYLSNGHDYVLTAKRYPLHDRELFKFSTDPNSFSESTLLGIMHANENHNIYWLLDQPHRISQLDLSALYLVIGYHQIHKEQLQRKFTVLVPPDSSDYQLAMEYQDSFLQFSSLKSEIATHLNNLQTWENQSCNSTKNFVLADPTNPNYRYLEMKKESDNAFELTIQHPLSPLQAMAIAMTRFDAQLK